MGNVLKIDNLRYKNILKNITFSLEEKSFNILIGSNGSGKTTLINCIRGLLQYDGVISIFNNTIDQKNNSEIGFFIDEEIFLENTVFEELLNVLKNLDYKENKAKKTIYSIAKKLDITQVLFKNLKDLTESENTLIAFFFSIIHDPKLLIIDNDLENLDEKQKNKIFDYLKEKNNLTVLFITNNSEYFSLANNLLILNDGKIVLSGTIEELIDNEKIFIKCGSKLPFTIDLSNKLISYELLDYIETDVEKMVNQIWK